MVDPVIPQPRTTCFLDKLMDIRGGDTVSGTTWRRSSFIRGKQAEAMAHIDRSSESLQAVLTLLQASEHCRRRQPEDFGIGEDLHEGLIYAARELVAGLRGYANAIERAALQSPGAPQEVVHSACWNRRARRRHAGQLATAGRASRRRSWPSIRAPVSALPSRRIPPTGWS